MEIILLITALAASPFVGAIFDKPTRKRAAKVLNAWLQAEEPVAPRTMTQCLALEPRNKDWKSDTKLQELWDDAFKWFSIQDRDNRLAFALKLRSDMEAALAPYRKAVKSAQENIKENEEHFYVSSFDYDWLGKSEKRLRERESELKKVYSDVDLVALALSDMYGWGLYGNDLIRLASKEEMPRVDFLALAR